VITPADSAPSPPQQVGVLDASWYTETAPQDMRTHADEVMASHPGRPTPAEAVGRGVTPSSGG
jgi:hypothetical protein